MRRRHALGGWTESEVAEEAGRVSDESDTRANETIPDRLRARAADRPGGVATIAVARGRITFGEWEERSNAAARGLLVRGLRQGQRVALVCDAQDWVDYAVAYMAVLKAGGVAVPVPARLGAAHLSWVGDAARAVGLISHRQVVAVGGWTASVRELADGNPAWPVERGLRADAAAEIVFTSGTGGMPKGVVVTHRSALWTHALADDGRGERVVLHSLPPGTTSGQGLLIQPLDARPHRVVTLPRFEARDLLRAVEDYRATDVVLTPALGARLVHGGWGPEYDLSSVCQVRTTSAPATPHMLEGLAALFPAAAVVNLYSTTEAWPRRVRRRWDGIRRASVGRPAGGTVVRVCDPDGRELGPGVPGDVQLGHADAPQRSFHGDLVGTRRVFLEGGWVRTGDVGYLDEAGELCLLDRREDLVRTPDAIVSTVAVEAAAADFPGVLEAAAVGVPDGVLGEYVALAVRGPASLPVAELRRFVRERLGAASRPRCVLVVQEFPRTALGKVIKGELRERLAALARANAAEADGRPDGL